MLFDLRGRGRRRTVQIIYLSLAILMGGGLVLFGIGSSQSGGLFDAFSGENAGNSGTESVDKRVDRAVARTKANPRDAEAWSSLSIARFQRATVDGIRDDGTYTEDGKRRLGLAAAAWERHLALDPKVPSTRNAKLMVRAYNEGALNEPAKGVIAQQIVLDAEQSPKSEQFQLLALFAYRAGDSRTGDLASDRAVELAPKEQRTALRKALEEQKQAAASNAAQQATTTPAQ